VGDQIFITAAKTFYHLIKLYIFVFQGVALQSDLWNPVIRGFSWSDWTTCQQWT